MRNRRTPTAVWLASRRRRAGASLLAVVAAICFGAGAAAITPAAAHTMAGELNRCDDVTGNTWTIPGRSDLSGEAYVVLAENIPCSQARTLGAYMALGGARFKGWKCARKKHFNGGCGRFVHRQRGRTRQFVAWYPDLASPSGP
jgi:hypothetical protein